LDPDSLSEEVTLVAGPAAPTNIKLTAARGQIPLGPIDLVTAIYQLSRDKDPEVATAAREQVSQIPENVLAGALEAPLHPMVLDFYSTQVKNQGPLIERVLLNPNAHTETILSMAGQLGERETEIISSNQERLLGNPEIIEALYFNPKARMSTVQRLLELAVRNGLNLSRVPQYQELAAGILGEGKIQDIQAIDEDGFYDDQGLDDVFQEVMEVDYFGEYEEEGEEEDYGEEWEEEGFSDMDGDDDAQDDLNISMMPINAKIRLATLGSGQHRMILIKDSNRLVAMAAVQAPAVSDTEAARYASNKSLNEDVIRYITTKKEWQKNYLVKVNLVYNPKTPLAYSIRMLNHLRMLDLKNLAASKNVPSVLATSAKRLVKTRTGH